MKKLILSFALLLVIFSASAQSGESISYYYKGQKIYYPVSYDRLIAGIAPGYAFSDYKSLIARTLSMPEDSIAETLNNKQFIIKLGRQARGAKKNTEAIVSKLKTLSYILFARPVFVGPSGNYNSYGTDFIVKIKSSSNMSAMQRLMETTGCRLIRAYHFQQNIFILAAGKMSGYDALATANQFYETGLFEYAEPDKVVYDALHAAPNDPLYNLQWAHNNTGTVAQYNGTAGADMKMQQAWNITMGAPYIKIGLIDEGVDLTHPDLAANLLQGFNGLTLTANPGDGAPLSSARAHGTNCAGILAAVANNGIGVAGVAPNCKIIPAVIFDGNGDYLGDEAVAASFDYVRLAGADVISNSWGGGAMSSTIDDAINRAVTLGRNGRGCVVFFAAGNNNAAAISYPACNPQVIAVGGVTMCKQRKSTTSCDGEITWGANYGIGLDVIAPCVKIATTDIQGSGGYNISAGTSGNYFNTFNGTSAACPNAAGVAALIFSADTTLTATQATQILELSCDKLPAYSYAASSDPAQPNGTWNNETGHGSVNAYAALQLAQSGNYCSVQIQSSATKICNGPVLLSIVNADSRSTYQWRRNGAVVASGITYATALPGTYDAIVTKGSCNAISAAIAIRNSVSLAVAASTDSVCAGGGVVLNANVASNTSNYASTTYKNGTGEGDYISLVKIAGTTLNNATLGAASPFCTLFPQLGTTTAILSGNSTYTLSVAGGTYFKCLIRAWIDYNQDGVFSASESIGISDNVGNLTTGAFIFTIPANAANGVTRLRLRSGDMDPGPGLGDAAGITNSNYGETEDYMITIVNGVPLLTYAWTESAAIPTLAATNTASVAAANILQSTTYNVTVTSNEGCINTGIVAVNTRLNTTSVIFTKSNATCYNSTTGSIAVNAIGGIAPYQYKNGLSGTYQSSNVFNGLRANNYRIYVQDAGGCAANTSLITINQPAAISATFTKTDACNGIGSATGSVTATAIGGTPPYLYKNGTSGSYQSSNVFTGLIPNNYRIYIQDANGCTGNTALITVGQLTPVTATYTQVNASCTTAADGSIMVTGSGGAGSYVYKNGLPGTYQSSNVFTSLRANNYRIYLQDANGCTGSTSLVTIAALSGTCATTPMSKTGAIKQTENKLSQVSISPNPSTSQFTVSVHDTNKLPVMVRVLDMNGKKLYEHKGVTDQAFRFGQQFASGIYLIEVTQGDNVKTLKAVKE